MGVRDADGHKLGYHAKKVADWMDGRDTPLHAEIGITNKCNHHCTFCTLDWITHGSNVLNFTVLGRAIHDMKLMGIKSIYLAGEGEPTLHPDFAKIVEGTKKMGISVAVSTNGQRFTPELAMRTLRYLSWIRFSVVSTDKWIYSGIHGVSPESLQKVLDNIKYAVEIKRAYKHDVDIGVQAILTKTTAPRIENFVLRMKEIGVDNVQIKPCHNHPSSSHKAKMDQDLYSHLEHSLKHYETEDFSVVFRTRSMERILEPRTWTRCHGFDFYALINANGDVVPCNVFYNKKDFTFGNIYDISFFEAWTTKRKEIIDKIECAKFAHCGDYRCRLDVMNRHLHRVKNPERNDEFI